MSQDVIARNFSRRAESYDRYSSVQDECALQLASMVRGGGFSMILDVGCGTGNFTRLLRENFPGAGITAVDISGDMVRVARGKLDASGVDFMVKDATEPGLRPGFDLISSNAAFHWFKGLEETLGLYRGLLADGGVIAFSIFGPLTFYELERSLKDVDGRNVSITSCDFAAEDEVRAVMNRLFKPGSVQERLYEEEYESLRDLLRKIKYTGTGGYGPEERRIWTRQRLESVERAYLKRFRSIRATYQVFFCRGVK